VLLAAEGEMVLGLLERKEKILLGLVVLGEEKVLLFSHFACALVLLAPFLFG